MGGKKRLVFGVLVLVLLASANRVWYMLNLPLLSEELESLQRFVLPGWQAALTDYSSARNHVLHSLMTKVLIGFSVPDVMAIRIPALLASVASAVIVFLMVLRGQSARFGFFSAGVWMASLGGLFSGSVGRGHALVAFFAVTAYYAYLRLEDGSARPALWSTMFVASCALGFLSVPTFVLPYATFVVSVTVHYRLHRDRLLLRRHGINLALAALAGLVLYLPILLNNPVTALTDNVIIREYDLANFTFAGVTAHARAVLSSIDALVAGLFIPLAFIAIWLQQDWKGPFMSQAVIMVLVSLAYVGLAGKLPPAQTLVFMVPFIIMAVSEGLHNGYQQVSQRYRKGMMVLIALLPILVLINSNRALYGSMTQTVNAAVSSGTDAPPLPRTEDPLPESEE